MNVRFDIDADGDVNVWDGGKRIAFVRWGTGSNSGWYLVPTNSAKGAELNIDMTLGEKIAELEEDLQLVLQKVREKYASKEESAKHGVQQIVDCAARLGWIIPHQDVLAKFLTFWFDIGDYEMLGERDREIVTKTQFQEIWQWCAERATVYVIKFHTILEKGDGSARRGDGYHVRSMPGGCTRPTSWRDRASAEHHLVHQLGAAGRAEVEEITLIRLQELVL